MTGNLTSHTHGAVQQLTLIGPGAGGYVCEGDHCSIPSVDAPA